MKYLIILILSFISFGVLSQENQIKYGTVYVKGKYDTLPEYPGGEFALYDFITTNFRPNHKIKSDVGGYLQQLVISAEVSKDGQLSQIQIRECSSVSVEQEMVRVLRLMPDWKPAMNKGVKTSAEIHIPYSFRIEGSFISHNPIENPSFGIGRTKKARFLKTLLLVGTLGFFFLVFS